MARKSLAGFTTVLALLARRLWDGRIQEANEKHPLHHYTAECLSTQKERTPA